jgi:hypothetical protein
LVGEGSLDLLVEGLNLGITVLDELEHYLMELFCYLVVFFIVFVV